MEPPLVIRTWPLFAPAFRSVAVGPDKTSTIAPVATKRRLAGLYSSAPAFVAPPATSPWPFGSDVRVSAARADRIEPTSVNLLVWGLYSSALASGSRLP